MPFEDKAWLAVLTVATVYSTVLFINIRLEKIYANNDKTSIIYRRPFVESAFTTLTALTQQG